MVVQTLPTDRLEEAQVKERIPLQSVDLEVLRDLRDPTWDSQVLSHPDGTVFHTLAWGRVLSRTYGHQPFYLRYSRKGSVTALVPLMEVRSWVTGRRGISLPFSDLCDPLFFGWAGAKRILEDLRDLAAEQRWRYFEVRGEMDLPVSAIPSMEFYAHGIDLVGTPDEVFHRFEGSVRRAIRKAERSSLLAKVEQSWEALSEFYALHARTRRRQGVPPQPRKFFRNIHEEIISPGYGFVVLARKGAAPVAGAVFLLKGRQANYKYAASEKAYQELRGSNLVLWHGLRHLQVAGCESLHLGRTSLVNDGLRRFKLGWGGTERKLPYFAFDTVTETWKVFRDRAEGMHNQIFRRAPLAVNGLAGALVYPHLD